MQEQAFDLRMGKIKQVKSSNSTECQWFVDDKDTSIFDQLFNSEIHMSGEAWQT